MGIDISNYKMVYKNKVYNCLNFMPVFLQEHISSEADDIKGKPCKPDRLNVLYIDSNNRINSVVDDTEEFQFLSK